MLDSSSKLVLQIWTVHFKPNHLSRLNFFLFLFIFFSFFSSSSPSLLPFSSLPLLFYSRIQETPFLFSFRFLQILHDFFDQWLSDFFPQAALVISSLQGRTRLEFHHRFKVKIEKLGFGACGHCMTRG